MKANVLHAVNQHMYIVVWHDGMYGMVWYHTIPYHTSRDVDLSVCTTLAFRP